jgi:hypothetical protein
MKKDRYVYPEVSLDLIEIHSTLLSESSDLSSSASLEGFDDNGDLVAW